MEKDRVQHYLHPSTEPKLMSKIEHEILAEHETKLLEKEGSGVFVVVKQRPKRGFGEIVSLVSQRIPNGVDPIAKAFNRSRHGARLGTRRDGDAKHQRGRHGKREATSVAVYGRTVVRSRHHQVSRQVHRVRFRVFSTTTWFSQRAFKRRV